MGERNLQPPCTMNENNDTMYIFSGAHVMVSPEQGLSMIEYMEQHPGLAQNKFSGSQGASMRSQLWRELTTKLNSCATGTYKTTDGWIECLEDWKSEVKGKAQRVTESMAATGGEQQSQPLTVIEERLLFLIGYTSVMGSEEVSEPLVLREHQTYVTMPLHLSIPSAETSLPPSSPSATSTLSLTSTSSSSPLSSPSPNPSSSENEDREVPQKKGKKRRRENEESTEFEKKVAAAFEMVAKANMLSAEAKMVSSQAKVKKAAAKKEEVKALKEKNEELKRIAEALVEIAAAVKRK